MQPHRHLAERDRAAEIGVLKKYLPKLGRHLRIIPPITCQRFDLCDEIVCLEQDVRALFNIVDGNYSL